MTDVHDVTQSARRAGDLYREASAIDSALANFDAGGIIASMMISAPPPTEPEWRLLTPAMVDTTHFTYPATMKDAIIAELHQRRAAINQELADLGLTGLPRA